VKDELVPSGYRRLGDTPLDEIGFSVELLDRLTGIGIDVSKTYSEFNRFASVPAFKAIGDEAALDLMRRIDAELTGLGCIPPTAT
jgi:hypothetical protein